MHEVVLILTRFFPVLLTLLALFGNLGLALSAPDRQQVTPTNTSRAEFTYQHLPDYFQILLSGIHQTSADYMQVLEWVEQMRGITFSGSAEEAKTLKNLIDQSIKTELQMNHVSIFDELLHTSGLIDIYNKIPVQGRLYDALASVENRIETKKLSSEDIQLFTGVLQKEGLTIEAFREITLKKVGDFSPHGEVYNGFPLAHMSLIASSGIRNGLAYGPPGSFQVEGILPPTKWRTQSIGAKSKLRAWAKHTQRQTRDSPLSV